MLNSDTKHKMEHKVEHKVVYSLRVHLALRAMGFTPVLEMKNPKNDQFVCWLYEQSPEFNKAFNTLVERHKPSSGKEGVSHE